MNELFLGQLPEALFIALFVLNVKGLKTKRLLYVSLIIMQYIVLIYTFPYNIAFQIFLLFSIYVISCYVYKEETQIIDVFVIIIAFIIMMLSSVISYVTVVSVTSSMVAGAIISRILMFVILFAYCDEFKMFYSHYCYNWNRHNDNKIKSLTTRNISILVMNILHVIINFYLIYTI